MRLRAILPRLTELSVEALYVSRRVVPLYDQALPGKEISVTNRVLSEVQ